VTDSHAHAIGGRGFASRRDHANVALIRCTMLVPTPSALAVFKMPAPDARRVLMARSTFAMVLAGPA
jgi:hypothetical protein